MQVRVAIVDDEPRAHNVIENYVARLPELELVGSFLNAESAAASMESSPFDLVFLDITMPGADGFAFLEMINHASLVIFTTAHTEFALKSYEYNAVDYLKKPIPFDRFTKAVKKAIVQLEHADQSRPVATHINLRIDGELSSIPFDRIKYFQSLGNYIKVITNDRVLLSQVTTNEIENALPRELFIRVHKSYILNRTKIDSVAEGVIMIGEKRVPIGRTFKRYVKKTISQMS